MAAARFEWNGSTEPGFLVRWLSPGDWLAVGIPPSDQKARLLRRKDDGVYTGVAWSSTAHMAPIKTPPPLRGRVRWGSLGRMSRPSPNPSLRGRGVLTGSLIACNSEW